MGTWTRKNQGNSPTIFLGHLPVCFPFGLYNHKWVSAESGDPKNLAFCGWWPFNQATLKKNKPKRVSIEI